MCRTIDAILTGAYTGEFDVALERFAAFCRVVALGQAVAADTRHEPMTASGLSPDELAALAAGWGNEPK